MKILRAVYWTLVTVGMLILLPVWLLLSFVVFKRASELPPHQQDFKP